MADLPRVVVLQFPGSNCERETAAAARAAGMEAEVVRWNLPERLEGADAVVLPGGFSFQDRVRAGAVAAKERIMEQVAGAVAGGTPVLGICNGAQILLESGLVPGWEAGRVEAALGANMVHGRSGYLSTWIHVRTLPETAGGCPWLCDLGGDPLPLPVAHAEGRFLISDDDRERAAACRGLVYCRPDGSEAAGFPHNPNGSVMDMAGMVGSGGAALAMMPHPERAAWMWQVPPAVAGAWGSRRRELSARELLAGSGPGMLFFTGLARWLEVRP
jgi:phosphoribosylformylglycinamidine synthase